MNNPIFSIVIPAKGRPGYLNETIQSVVAQNFKDIEIIISNNGADPALKAVVNKYLKDDRIKYVEHETVLSMPAHWEKITQSFTGQYLMILTDRSVLKAGTLTYLHEYINQQSKQPDILCWPWDIYFDDLKVLIPFNSKGDGFEILNSDTELCGIAEGKNPLDSKLPRGLNSCVNRDLIKSMRNKYGSIFKAISPDITFAYLCLMNAKEFAFSKRPLFISQGLKASNGGNTYVGDTSAYSKLLNLDDPFTHAPIKCFLFHSSLNQDFLSIADLCSRQDLLELWNKEKYYLDCLKEFNLRKIAGLQNNEHIQELNQHIEKALANETPAIREYVTKKITTKSLVKLKFTYLLKKAILNSPKLYKLVLLITKRNSKTLNNILNAAGFD